MKMEQIDRRRDPETAANALLDILITRSRSAIRKKGHSVWAVSGGSSIHKIYNALKARSLEWSDLAGKLTILWVDERHVPYSSEHSNYGNAYRRFWSNMDGVKLLPVPYGTTVEESASLYRQTLVQEQLKRDSIDITILGMGTDGHVASLFPGHHKLKEKDEIIASVRYRKVEQPRVTMTFPMINASDSILLYFYGTEKGEVFKKALHAGDAAQYPVCGLQSDKLHVFTDQQVI